MSGRMSLSNVLLRLLVPVGILGALLSTSLVEVEPAVWLVVLVAGLSIGFAVYPESVVGTFAMIVVLIWWGVALRDGLHPEALVASAGLLLAHLAATVTALGPATLSHEPWVLRRWALRGVGVFLVAPVLWALATALRGQPEPAGVWAGGLVVAVLVTLAASTAFRHSTEEP